MKHKKIQGIDPMGLFKPWSDSSINNRHNYQNIDNKTNMASCWKALNNSLNNCDGLNQWAFVPLGPTLTHTTSKLNNLRNCFESNECIYCDSCNKKTGTLANNFHNFAGESNAHVQFGYTSLEIFNKKQVQVSGSVNADPINMMHTSQQKTE